MDGDEQLKILKAEWDERADREMSREERMPRKQVHTDLIRREIRRRVGDSGPLSVLDAGAGTGRFSIPLARDGHRVVHLDISPKMLDLARENAKAAENIEFAEGSVTDLSRFGDRSFDLVLCLDSPLSFCYADYGTALSELVRVCRRTLILCFMERTAMITEGVNFDLQHFGRLRTVPKLYDTGTLLVTKELRKLQPSLLSSWHAFSVEEISELLVERGWKAVRVAALAALSRFAEPDLLRKLFEDAKAYAEYLDFEESYGLQPTVLGMSSGAGGGLLVTAKPARWE